MEETWYAVSDESMAALGWKRTAGKASEARYRAPDGSEATYSLYRRRLRALQSPDRADPTPVEVVDLPNAPQDKPTPEVKKLGLATAEELAMLAYYGVMIATAILAFGTKTPALAMTHEEGWALAVPIGNILQRSELNRRYGTALRDGGDWAAIGYVLYAYLMRAGQQVNRQRQSGQLPANAPRQPTATPITNLPNAAVSPVPPAVQPTPTAPNGRADAPPDFARSQPFTPRPSNP